MWWVNEAHGERQCAAYGGQLRLLANMQEKERFVDVVYDGLKDGNRR